jgi:spermidine/putrescine transport system substrate-binding protein
MSIDLDELKSRFVSGRIDRRAFLGALGKAGLALGVVGGPLPGLARYASAQSVPEVHFDTWGGSISEAFAKYAFPPFEKATGTKVVSGTLSDADEYFARVKASNAGEYQMFHGSGDFDYKRYVDNGLTAVLNESAITRLPTVMPRLIEPLRKLSGGTLSAVPYDYGSTGIAYNTKYVSKAEVEEQGAKIFLNPKYAGKISVTDDWITRIWYAALATGQDPNNVADENAIWDNLRSLQKSVLKFWSSGADVVSLLGNEEVYIADAWSGRVAALQQSGKPIGWYDPPKSYGWQDYIMVLKGAPLEACEKLIDFLLDPVTANAVAIAQSYAPSLDPSKVALSAEVKALPNFDPTGQLAGLTFDDAVYWSGKQDAWSETCARILKGA